jgi:hypothetical protein
MNPASCSLQPSRYTDYTIPAVASGKHFLEHCPWSWQLLSWSNACLMEPNSLVLCSQQPAQGLSQMETAVLKFSSDFIPQKSVCCTFTLVGTSNLTVKQLVIRFTLQCLILTVLNFSKWVSRSSGVLRRHVSSSTKCWKYSLHAPIPLYFFFTLPDYQLEKSSWISRNTCLEKDP